MAADVPLAAKGKAFCLSRPCFNILFCKKGQKPSVPGARKTKQKPIAALRLILPIDRVPRMRSKAALARGRGGRDLWGAHAHTASGHWRLCGLREALHSETDGFFPPGCALPGDESQRLETP